MSDKVEFQVEPGVGAIFKTIGTCSICSGPVMTQALGDWNTTFTCGDCGATMKGYGPIIPMHNPTKMPE